MRRTIIAKTLLVNPDGRVLILRRSSNDENSPGRADLPGGGVEPNESYAVAAARETGEEAGLLVQPEDLQLIYTFTKYDDAKDSVLLRLLYTAQVSNTDVQLSHEHDAYSWQTTDEVARIMSETSWKDAVNFALQHNLLPTS